MSVVYFVQAVAGGPVKIGRTSNLQRRLKALKTANSNDPRVLRTVSGGKIVEAWFHDQFKMQHIAREWFYFHAEMLTVQPPQEPTPSRSPVAPVDIPSVRELMHRAWAGHVAQSAQDASGVSFGTAKSWTSGRFKPSADAFLQMAARDPDLRREIISALQGRRGDLLAVQNTAAEADAVRVAK